MQNDEINFLNEKSTKTMGKVFYLLNRKKYFYFIVYIYYFFH